MAGVRFVAAGHAAARGADGCLQTIFDCFSTCGLVPRLRKLRGGFLGKLETIVATPLYENA